MNIGFIGAGKVGCTLGKYLAADQPQEIKIKGYYSRSRQSAQEAARFTDSGSYESMKDLIKECDVIFLTVPDSSIQDTWQQVKEYDIKGKTICHCSGAMSSRDAFPGLEETGAFGYSIHPLFAVSDKYNAYRELTGVFFALEGGRPQRQGVAGADAEAAEVQQAEVGADFPAAQPGAASDAYSTAGQIHSAAFCTLKDLLEARGNPTRLIKAEDKTTYHCAAAVASNLVCGLIDQSIALMKRCGFEEEEAVKALAPILTGNMEHIAAKGPTASLTGPIERNDVQTVKKHLDCLEGSAEKTLYRLLSSRLVDMAQTRHPDRDYSQMADLIAIAPDTDAGMSQLLRKEETK